MTLSMGRRYIMTSETTAFRFTLPAAPSVVLCPRYPQDLWTPDSRGRRLSGGGVSSVGYIHRSTLALGSTVQRKKRKISPYFGAHTGFSLRVSRRLD